MSNIIDKIQLSGVTYDIGGQGSGVSVVEITQSEYDVLPSSAKTDTSKMYVITDAEAGDLTNYYTKTEVDNAITAATSTKQDTLVSGTNIKTINNESLLGSGNIDIQGGGGKAIEAGTNISVTTGTTADTINCTLPISAGTGENSVIGNITQNTASGKNALAFGGFYNSSTSYGLSVASGLGSVSFGGNASGEQSFAAASMASTASGQRSATIAGYSNNSKGVESLTSGRYVNAENPFECSLGFANVSYKANNTFGNSGNTLFSVGNGTSTSARHNAFEIRQNGDIYISSGGTDIKLQDHLGGGGGGGISSAECQTMIDNSISGKADESAFTAHTANTSIHVTTAQTAAWDAKSNFSGNYNDLTDKPTIPTVPTSNTAFTNDAGYITVNDITGKTDVTAFTAHTGDSTIHVTSSDKTSWNGAVTALGGLSLVKLTQSAYDALSPNYDSNTLYIIVN